MPFVWIDPSEAGTWDDANLRTVSTRLRTEAADAFDRVCHDRNLSRYEAVRRFCLTVVRDETLLDLLDRGEDAAADVSVNLDTSPRAGA